MRITYACPPNQPRAKFVMSFVDAGRQRVERCRMMSNDAMLTRLSLRHALMYRSRISRSTAKIPHVPKADGAPSTEAALAESLVTPTSHGVGLNSNVTSCSSAFPFPGLWPGTRVFLENTANQSVRRCTSLVTPHRVLQTGHSNALNAVGKFDLTRSPDLAMASTSTNQLSVSSARRRSAS